MCPTAGRDLFTYTIAEDLIQGPIGVHQTVHSSQPQAQEAVVDALHQHNLTHNEDGVPDVAAEVTGHCKLMFHNMAQRMLTVTTWAIQGVLRVILNLKHKK